jgi:hypothetical protein
MEVRKGRVEQREDVSGNNGNANGIKGPNTDNNAR